MSLPAALRRYWERRTLGKRAAAWLTCDEAGRVQDSGGALASYGLDGLHVGDDAEEALPCMVGIRPAAGKVMVLPFVQMQGADPAEVHIGAEGTRRHVLLLDASQGHAEAQGVQQRRHESSLGMRTELEEDARRFADALEVLVLQHVEDFAFKPFTRVPAWAKDLCEVDTTFSLPEVFPFLESFLPEAERVWDGGGSGTARSGPWTRGGPFGSEVHLEAVAMYLPQVGPVLILELLGDRYWERQRALQLARERRLALEDLSREKDGRTVLIHAIVHDLKGPLTGIKGAVDLLALMEDLPEDARQLLDTATRGCKKQQGLIQDIAAVFRDAGTEAATGGLDEVMLADCAREVVAYMAPGFTSVEREIAIDVAADAERVMCRGNRIRMERVFANLLENARRHTPRHGRTTVRVKAAGDMLRASVENEGEPVPPELVDNLFDRFVSGSKAGTSGIGLYYCRITVERWGGIIRYEPLEGGGAVFVFELPLA